MKILKSIEIAARPQKVWEFVTEPDKIMEWWSTLKKFEYAGDQREGEGARVYLEDKIGPTPLMKINLEVSDWQENERIAFKMISGEGAKTYKPVLLLEPSKVGTRFTFAEEIELDGVLGRLLEFVARRSVETCADDCLKKLKRRAEAA